MNHVKVYARKCQVRELSFRSDKKVIDDFLELHHLQGKVRGGRVAFGLFHNNELIQLMTFGTPRFQKAFQWEIIRECTRAGWQYKKTCSRFIAKLDIQR